MSQQQNHPPLDLSKGWTPVQIENLVEVRDTETKGRCLYTKIPLDPGQVIFVESPMLTSTPSLDKEVWDILNKCQKEQPMDLPPVWHMAALYTLSQLPKDVVDICLDKWVPPESMEVCDDVKRVHSRLPPATTKKIKTNEYQQAVMAWRYNSFGHHSDSDGLVMYNRISMMSHSCQSTCCWHYGDNDTFILRAMCYKLAKVTIG
eukprot:gene797-1043_t